MVLSYFRDLLIVSFLQHFALRWLGTFLTQSRQHWDTAIHHGLSRMPRISTDYP